MIQVAKLNPCNKCWNPPKVQSNHVGPWYRCCGRHWLGYREWQALNPLPEKPLTDAEIQRAVRIMPPDYDAEAGEISDELYNRKDDPVKVEEKSVTESLPPCWCKSAWVNDGLTFVHPRGNCVLSGCGFSEEYIRFIFGENPCIKELESDIKKLEKSCTELCELGEDNGETIRELTRQRDELQAKLDAVPPERFTSIVAYQNVCNENRLLKAFLYGGLERVFGLPEIPEVPGK